jgi:hypothetical protein
MDDLTGAWLEYGNPEMVSLLIERDIYGAPETESLHFRDGTILWISFGPTPVYCMWRDRLWHERQRPRRQKPTMDAHA